MRQYLTYYFKNLMRVSNKFYFAIKRSRFTCANRYCSYFFNFLAMLIELIQLISFSISFDIEVLYTWIEASSYSSACFFENELLSILITFSIRLCKDDSIESSRLQAWLRVLCSRLNIVVNWTVLCERSN